MSTNTPLFSNQVGGHGDILIAPCGRLLKPFSEKEHSFYEYIRSTALPPAHHFLRHITPIYFGTRDSTMCTTHLLELQNTTADFSQPCILDIKLGTRLYDYDAKPEKVKRMITGAKVTTSGQTGVRLAGMRALKRDGGRERFEKMTQDTGRKLKVSDLVSAMKWFVHDGTTLRTDAVSSILREVRIIADDMRNVEDLCFYGCSLLVVYEGNVSIEGRSLVDVRLIDFAHTMTARGARDDGVVRGLECVMGMLSEVSCDDVCVRVPEA